MSQVSRVWPAWHSLPRERPGDAKAALGRFQMGREYRGVGEVEKMHQPSPVWAEWAECLWGGEVGDWGARRVGASVDQRQHGVGIALDRRRLHAAIVPLGGIGHLVIEVAFDLAHGDLAISVAVISLVSSTSKRVEQVLGEETVLRLLVPGRHLIACGGRDDGHAGIGGGHSRLDRQAAHGLDEHALRALAGEAGVEVHRHRAGLNLGEVIQEPVQGVAVEFHCIGIRVHREKVALLIAEARHAVAGVEYGYVGLACADELPEFALVVVLVPEGRD
jgi:hypothetical protein